jgi:flagellar hook-length control protein FliK
MTMSVQTMPPRVAPRPAGGGNPATTGTDASASDFAGLVAEVVAASRAAATLPSATVASATVPPATVAPATLPDATAPGTSVPTGTVPTGTVPTGTVPTGTVPTGTVPTGTVPTGTVPIGTVPIGTVPTSATNGGDTVGKDELDKAVPAGTDAAALAGPLAMAGLPVVVAGLPVVAAGAVPPVPVPAKAAGPAVAAATAQQPTGAGAVGPSADPTAAAVGADAGGAAGQGAPSDQPGTGQPPVAVVPGTPSGPASGSVARTLTTAVQEIVAAKTSDPAAGPTVATIATGQGVGAPAPAVATPVPVLPTIPGSPSATAAQIVPVLFAVHQAGVGGTHRMTVDITPPELGPVRLTVSMRDGQLHVLLAGSSDLSREALRAALPELRKLVEGAGITAGAFDVQPDQRDAGRPSFGNGQFLGDTSGGGSRATHDHPPPGSGEPAEKPSPAPQRRDVNVAQHFLDLHL